MCIDSPFQRRLPRFSSAVVALAVAVYWSTAAIPAVRAADDDVEIDSPPDAESEDVDPPGPWEITDETDVRHNLEMLLRRRIAFVDRICTLTDSQKQKLDWVSRGDVKRLLDRIHEINNEFQFADISPAERAELLTEVQQIKSGGCTIRSLSANVMGKLLTSDQLARYEPLRMVILTGGRIQTEGGQSGEVLEIDVHETEFAGDDAVHFSTFPHLLRLFLSHTKITDDGLAHMQGLTNLEWLDISGTQVSDVGLQYLEGLTNLQWLSLAGTTVTDSSLAHLRGLAKLQALSLEGTPVTNAGLAHLAGLTRLERLNLKNTQVTDAGVASLQRALPKLAIQVRDRHLHGNRGQGGMGCGFF